jgi:hypothetical protein
MLCGLEGIYQHFGGTYIHFQGHFSPEDGGSMFLQNVGTAYKSTNRKTSINIFTAMKTTNLISFLILSSQISKWSYVVRISD